MKKRANQKGSDTPTSPMPFCGCTEICQLVIDNADSRNPADHRGRTPLHEAAKNGHTDVWQLLINDMYQVP